MTLITDIREGINEGLAEVGYSAKFRRATVGSWTSTSTPSKGKALTNVDYTVLVAISSYKDDEYDESFIQRGDKKVEVALDSTTDKDGVAVAAFVPEVTDFFVDGSEIWKIVNVQLAYIGSTVVHATVQVRK